MAISDTYRRIIIEDYIKDSLSRGVALDAEDVSDAIEALIEDLDLSIPQFASETFYTAPGEASSAAKHLDTFGTILKDLKALYAELVARSASSIDQFERWQIETELLEKRLADLENRIENLLLLTDGTEGYHSVIIDNFTDTFNIDLDETDAEIDLRNSLIQIGSTSSSGSKLDLSSLEKKDVSFVVRSTKHRISQFEGTRGGPPGKSDIRNPFRQESASWWSFVKMKQVGPVTAELLVKLGELSVPLNRISLDLHTSAETSTTTITPLYSTDNATFSQLPTNTPTIETKARASFSFPDIDAKWIKFILTKNGPEAINDNDGFTYQFGFKEIAFYTQAFSATNPDGDNIQTFISEPRYQLGNDGLPLRFEKLTLEVCEKIEEDTDIKYYIATSNDSSVPVNTAKWVPISPIGRASPVYPQILNIGETSETELGVSEEVIISYDSSATNPDLVNPAETFRLLSLGSAGVLDEEVSVYLDRQRYRCINKQDRILNYQIKHTDYSGSGTGDGLDINELSFQLWRNIGEKGLDGTDTSNQVRDIPRGWGFEEPYYFCTIEIQSPNGMTMDVGDAGIIIDDVRYTNTIPNTILTGKTNSTTGTHRIKVHKDNWKIVPTGLTSSANLKTYDVLYPYNHKLLIEGYDYPTSFSGEQVYEGADVFAERVAEQINVFDLINNTMATDYGVYALDLDAPDTHTGGNSPTQVIVLKVDPENPDFVNEHFMIRFNLVNQLMQYLRVRADLMTEDSEITPEFHGYQIKLA